MKLFNIGKLYLGKQLYIYDMIKKNLNVSDDNEFILKDWEVDIAFYMEGIFEISNYKIYGISFFAWQSKGSKD